MASASWKELLRQDAAIPAHPLALTRARRLDERRQRALSRYYIASGATGLAVGVHTTQFQIRQPEHGLFRPVLELAAEEINRAGKPLARIAGVCGQTRQATDEAALIRDLGYHAALLSLAALAGESEDTLIDHCRAVAGIIPIIGFYLQPAVGGMRLPYSFWCRLCEIENLIAIKMAPFNRYQTLDVVRAVIDSGRDDVTLYTGNDDNIIADFLTPYRIGGRERRIVGGLLGHWSVWTQKSVEIHRRCRGAEPTADLLRLGVEVTDANAAFFDATNGYAGCIAGLHEVLRRQGLLENIECLNPKETLGPGQMHEIDRVYRAYPHLADDEFVMAHRDRWLA